MLSANERRESTDIKSSGAEVKTVARGMVVMLKSSDAVGVIDWLIEQGLTSPPTQYRLYGRRFFYRSQDPTNSIKEKNTIMTQ